MQLFISVLFAYFTNHNVKHTHIYVERNLLFNRSTLIKYIHNNSVCHVSNFKVLLNLSGEKIVVEMKLWMHFYNCSIISMWKLGRK